MKSKNKLKKKNCSETLEQKEKHAIVLKYSNFSQNTSQIVLS